jgi:hypothetical protein
MKTVVAVFDALSARAASALRLVPTPSGSRLSQSKSRFRSSPHPFRRHDIDFGPAQRLRASAPR